MPITAIEGFLSEGKYKETVEALVAEFAAAEKCLEEMKETTGETLEAYKKVLKDKLWKVSNLNIQFYHNVIFEVMATEVYCPQEEPQASPQS